MKEKTTIKDAIDILYRFNWTVKIAKIYESNNLIFIRQIKSLLYLIQKAVEVDGEVTFMLRQSTLFFNGIRLKFGFSSYFLLKFIINEFPKREIGILSFKTGLNEEELKNFIILFTKKGSKSKITLEDFLKEFKQYGIKHISIEKISPFDELSNKKKDTAKIFFLSITHLKETFKKQKANERLPLLTTRRLMQSIFNNITQNESFLYGLTTIKNFDEYTLNHSINVCILSISLGKRMGLDRNELIDLGMSAFFHDIGKLDIPKEILLKPGKLDKDERDVIEKHPYYGAEKLIELRELSRLPVRAIHVAMEHHTSDGHSGYPIYTEKKTINLFSKIVKIIDFFDAITTKRPYRNKDFTREEAINMMLEKSGTEFDPLILKVFVNMMGTCPVGTLVLLNSGEIAIVIEINQETAYMLRPKVKLITDETGNKLDGEIVDLTEMDPKTNKYKRTIVKSLDQDKYNIKASDYFVAQTR